MITQGSEYVLMCGGAPVICNSQHSPANPSRVVVTKVGRVWARFNVSGGSDRARVDGNAFSALVPIDTAKELYGAALFERERMVPDHTFLTPTEIFALVNAL